MNIGIIIPGFSADADDWCIPVYRNLVRGLAEDHDVRVFPMRYPPTDVPYTFFDAQVFPIGGGSYTHGWRRLGILRRAYHALVAQHTQRPFDVLHAIWADEPGMVANWFGRKHGIPTVVSIAGGELVGIKDIRYGLQLGILSRWLVKQALAHANAIIVHCQYARNLTLQHLSTEKQERLRQVPLGVDSALFTLSSSDVRPRDFLHVGSLQPIKDQITLLHLMARLPGATLDIVGDGPLWSTLKALAHQLDITDRVVFHGNQPHDVLPDFYRQANFLLMTSRHEAFGMVAIEALACGTGVIGTDVGIFPEIGVMAAPAGDIDALQTAIVQRPRKHSRIQRTRCRWLAENVYSLHHMKQGFLGVYEEVCRNVSS